MTKVLFFFFICSASSGPWVKQKNGWTLPPGCKRRIHVHTLSMFHSYLAQFSGQTPWLWCCVGAQWRGLQNQNRTLEWHDLVRHSFESAAVSEARLHHDHRFHISSLFCFCFLNTFWNGTHGVCCPAVPAADLVKTALCTHTHTHRENNDEMRHWQARGMKNLFEVDSSAIVGRKSVNDNKSLEVWRWCSVSLACCLLSCPPPVATRLWIVSQEQDP